jgi:hypothetical protein
VPYRHNHSIEPRRLVVRNHAGLRVAAAAGGGTAVALAGLALLPEVGVMVPPLGSEVAVSAVATVLALAGLTLVGWALRLRRARTVLAIERGLLTVTVHSGREAVSHHVVHLDAIDDVDLETIDGRHGARIVARGGTTLAIGDAMTAFLAHHRRHAADVRRFLRVARG